MYDENNPTHEIAGYKRNGNGVPTHMAAIMPDTEPMILMDGLASQFTDMGMDAGIRITQEPFLAHLRTEYYERDGGDNQLSHAWDRLRMSEYFGGIEAREIFERYVRIFRPGVAVYSVSLTTGNSQGDWVELVLWLAETDIAKHWDGEPTRAHAQARAWDALKAVCDEFEQAATGECYEVAVYELEWDMHVADMTPGEPLEVQFEVGVVTDSLSGLIGDEYAKREAQAMLDSA